METPAVTEPVKFGQFGEPVPVPRLNRLPLIAALLLVVIFLGVVFYGLSSRGLRFGSSDDGMTTPSRPASRFGDELTRNMPDGIIAEPATLEALPVAPDPQPVVPIDPPPTPVVDEGIEPQELWAKRIKREETEQVRRELQRQRMASLQADGAAYDSPIRVDLSGLSEMTGNEAHDVDPLLPAPSLPSALDAYRAALEDGEATTDTGGQAAKLRFLNQPAQQDGSLPLGVTGPRSVFELKRGSIIPATLITAINSDLPGAIIAQVSQNVYDTATGRHLLIAQGSRLLGKYDSEISFGQDRVLVVWTDLILTDGSSVRIDNMVGADPAGASGFAGSVDGHVVETFGSAILVALLGAGTQMLLPDSRSSDETSPRRVTEESFRDLSGQTFSRSLAVRPTIRIEAGCRFNVLVDRDLVFP